MSKIENPGDYMVRASKCELTETRNGDPQVYVRLETSDGHHLDWYLGFKSDKAEQYAIKSLRSMGWRGDDFSRLSAEDLPNEVEARVEHDTYNGETKLKVKWVNGPNDGPRTKPLDSNKAMSFAERMKAKVAAVDAKLAAEGASRSDEIPF
jgi:hypothetical protein